jgi:broad specificity phosphatase PhoE
MESSIYLTRHGQTEWNVQGRIQGQTDTVLSETGRRQAMALRDHFQGISLDSIISSDLTRARVTAEIIAAPHRLQVKTNTSFRERHYGSLEGRMIADFKMFFNSRDSTCLNALGENIEHEHAAARRFQGALENVSGKTLVVSHAGILLAFLKTQFPEKCGYWRIHDIPNGGIWKIARVNRVLRFLAQLDCPTID